MKLFPLQSVAEGASPLIDQGHTIFQQFLCSGCGIKQTMSEPNLFYTSGKCEECSTTTDIVKDGCNYMAIMNMEKTND